MTAPLNLEGRYRKVHQSSLERFFERTFNQFAIGILVICAAFILYMIANLVFYPPPAKIQNEMSPAEREHIAYLEKKYELKGHTWLIDRDTQEISYYRKGEWRVIR